MPIEDDAEEGCTALQTEEERALGKAVGGLEAETSAAGDDLYVSASISGEETLF
jgi:hypothetical protein